MPAFNQASLDNLKDVDLDLVALFLEVVKYRDCSVIWGLRTLEQQQALYAQGRGKSGIIVTDCDGVIKRSKHQDGRAVDVVPYPELYELTIPLREFGWFVHATAIQMLKNEEIKKKVKWGGFFRKSDLPHFEV